MSKVVANALKKTVTKSKIRGDHGEVIKILNKKPITRNFVAKHTDSGTCIAKTKWTTKTFSWFLKIASGKYSILRKYRKKRTTKKSKKHQK